MYFKNPEILLTPISEIKTELGRYCERKKLSKNLRTKMISILERNSDIWRGTQLTSYDRTKNQKHFLVQLLAVPPENLGQNVGKKSLNLMNDFLEEIYGRPFRLGLLQDMQDRFFPRMPVDPDEIIRRTCQTFSIVDQSIRSLFSSATETTQKEINLLASEQKKLIAALLSSQIVQSQALEDLGKILTPRFLYAVMHEHPEISEQAATAIVTAIQRKLDTL